MDEQECGAPQRSQALGHTIADTALRDVLLSLGHSLRANKKNIEGSSHVDRDAQFAQIKQQCEQFEAGGNPIISVDCKKKELLGNFKNSGQEWQAKGEETSVNEYDFLSLANLGAKGHTERKKAKKEETIGEGWPKGKQRCH
jgi:hypothetical protein